MSGAGRKSQYRKGVTDSFLYGFPVPGDNEFIMEVINSRGSNIFEVKAADGTTELTLLPKKFHKLIWVKRGEYVIVQRDVKAEENEDGVRVRSVIQHVLAKEQVKHLEQQGLWPEAFHESRSSKKMSSYSRGDMLPDGAEEEDCEASDGEVEEEEETSCRR